MKKQFEKRVRLVVYLDAADYEALKVRCAPDTVSNYARQLLTGRSMDEVAAVAFLSGIEKKSGGGLPAERKPCKHGLLFCKKCK
jgi:hypothetical protein